VNMFSLRTLALTTACLTLLACGGPTIRRGDAEDEGVISTGVQGNEVEEATIELCRKISERNARGWPGYVLMTTSEYGAQPLVRVGDLVNRTRRNELDMVALRNEIYNAVAEQDVVALTVQGDDLGSILDEIDFSRSGMTRAEIQGMADPVSLVLAGEVTGGDPVTDPDTGLTQYDYTFSLRLFDTQAQRIVPGLTVQKKFRKLRQD
jgi:Peptidoglycan-synthase activator LpoB